MHKTPPILDNGHHPEYARGIREAAAILEEQYENCLKIASGAWSDEMRKHAANKGITLIVAATNILDKIGEEPLRVVEERQRLAAEAAKGNPPPI